ncbi:MAG: type II toxin-antitoxin system HipA family toxin [Opitutales bacterium]
MSTLRLNVLYQGQRIGQIAETDRGIYFQYDVLFLREKHELSPLNLGLSREVYGPFDWAGNTIPGLFVDSLPDSFGMDVIRQRFLQEGRPMPSQVGLLAYQGSRTMGALSYEPSDGFADAQEWVDISAAVDSARKIVEKEHAGVLNRSFVVSGGTAGGARPKLLVAMDSETRRIVTGTDHIPEGMRAWLLKLTHQRDSAGAIERAYSRMAEASGIRVPQSRLVSDRQGEMHFAVERFDRAIDNPNLRIHTHTYAGLRQLDFRSTQNDYIELLETTYALTQSQLAVEEQFARMVFNVLAHNHDDHAKNFSFVYSHEQRTWSVSPAYDLMFTENDLGGPWMTLGGKRVGLKIRDLVEVGQDFMIKKARIAEIIDQTVEAVSNWESWAAETEPAENYRDFVRLRLKANLSEVTG